jgi:iron complex outermembrane receptor protein
MSQNKTMRDAVRIALGITTGVFALQAVPAFSQEDESAKPVEEVVVTGSRITRSTLNSQSQDTLIISAEDMQVAGDISVADALRTSNLNSLGSFRESSGSSAQSNATVNLRGLGAGRTLVLINGRRVAGSPSLGGGGTVNLNLIPFSAVDRIEVVADGASAIYGSDAIAGVVNIILKQNYDGLSISGRMGDRDRDSGTEESLSFLWGSTSDKGSVTFGLEYDKREPIFDADRDYTAARWGDYDGDGYITGYSETAGVSFYGYSAINPNYDPAIPYSEDNPASWYVYPGAGCADNTGSGGGFIGPVKSDLVFGPDTGFYCGYAYALVSANRAGLSRLNSWVSADYELSDNVEIYMDAIFSDNESFGRYAPPAAPGPTIPGDPRNDIGATFGYFRWVDIGTRDNVVNDTFIDINAGFKWDISDSVKLNYEYTTSDYRSASIGSYYLSYGGLEYNIAYDITDFDQFVANLKTTTLNDDRQSLNKHFLGLQFDAFDLPGGTTTFYVAAEYYEVDYAALVDAQSEAGLVGGSAGNSARGYRDVTAYSAEAIFPVLDSLELTAAVRYDDYSDFGTATSPRVGVNFVVPGYEQLRMFASYGKGFRAPDLSDLYGATSFSASGGVDYYGCQLTGQDPCPSRQFDTYIGSNPNLDAEKATSLSAGIEWDFIENWQIGATYISMDIEDSIEYTSAQDQLNVDFRSGGNNPAVQRNAQGQVLEIAAGFQNAVTEFNREAMDLSLQGEIGTGFGTFFFLYNATYYMNYDAEVTYGTGELFDAAGTLGFPEWRTSFVGRYNFDQFQVNLGWDRIGESESSVSDDKYDAWDIINASVAYDMNEWGVITLGANNLLDEDPLLDDFGSPVDEYQYSQVGRVTYVRYNIEF